MFHCKTELEELRKSNEEQKDTIRQQSVLVKNYEILLENVGRIQQKGDHRLYVYDGHLHFIKIKQDKQSNDYSVGFYAFRLSQWYHSDDFWITQALATVTMGDKADYGHTDTNRLTIDRLDTNSDFQRQGHASRIKSAIIDFARNHQIQLLCGELFERTPIGIKNLIHFYEKNAFKVGKSSFSMAIK